VADQDSGSKPVHFVKDLLIPALTVVTALLAGWVNYSVSHVKSELDVQRAALDAQKASLDSLTAERNLRRFDEDLTFRIYQAVSDSLKTKDTKQQQAATALVIVLAAEPLRTQLLQVFDNAETTAPEVRKTVMKVLQTEEKFQQEEAAVQPKPSKPPTPASGGSWGEWDVDVFWCERSGDMARSGAEAITKALHDEGARGRLRARILPDSINAQPGYRMRGFVIRRDAGEEERATALKTVAERALPGTQFEVTPSRQATRWYLSAFLCP
jgi:hypothetical protein